MRRERHTHRDRQMERIKNRWGDRKTEREIVRDRPDEDKQVGRYG